MTNQMIDAKIAQLEAIQAQVNMLNDQIESIKDELKGELDRLKVDSLSTNINNVFYNCYNRKTIDSAMLKKDGLYDKYAHENTVVSFKITKKTKVS